MMSSEVFVALTKMSSEDIAPFYKRAIRREAFKEVEDYPGPNRLIKRDVKVAGDQDCKVGLHKICTFVNDVCIHGGDRCDG